VLAESFGLMQQALLPFPVQVSLTWMGRGMTEERQLQEALEVAPVVVKAEQRVLRAVPVVALVLEEEEELVVVAVHLTAEARVALPVVVVVVEITVQEQRVPRARP